MGPIQRTHVHTSVGTYYVNDLLGSFSGLTQASRQTDIYTQRYRHGLSQPHGLRRQPTLLAGSWGPRGAGTMGREDLSKGGAGWELSLPEIVIEATTCWEKDRAYTTAFPCLVKQVWGIDHVGFFFKSLMKAMYGSALL